MLFYIDINTDINRKKIEMRSDSSLNTTLLNVFSILRMIMKASSWYSTNTCYATRLIVTRIIEGFTWTAKTSTGRDGGKIDG